MDATVRNLDGDDADTVELPAVFETTYRPDLIGRAVRAAQANRKQDYGADEFAGLRTPAESFGSGRGWPTFHDRRARTPRSPGRQGTQGAPAESREGPVRIDQHESKETGRPQRDRCDDRRRTRRRARSRVRRRRRDSRRRRRRVRGPPQDAGSRRLPRGSRPRGRHRTRRRGSQRPLRSGEARGRKYKTPTSILFVTSSETGPSRAARNLAGADVTTAAEVNAEDLAPGAQPGRLTVWTESALEEVADR